MESRIRESGEVNRLGALRASETHPPIPPLHLTPRGLELGQLHAQMFGIAPCDGHVPAGDRSRNCVGTGLEAIGNDDVVHGGELLHSSDCHQGSPGAPDVCPHGIELDDQVFDLRLAGCIDDDRLSLGENTPEYQVLGRPHRGEGKLDLGPFESTVDTSHELAMDQLEGRSHLLQTAHVPFDGTGTEIVSAGQRHPGLTTSGEKGAQDHDRCPHLTHELDGGFRFGLIRYDHPDLVVALRDVTTGVLQDTSHQLDVEYRRDIAQVMTSRGEECGDDLLEHRVLRTQCLHGSAETRSTLDEDSGHHGESTRDGRERPVTGPANPPWLPCRP